MGKTQYSALIATPSAGNSRSDPAMGISAIPKSSAYTQCSPMKRAKTKTSNAMAAISIHKITDEALLYQNEDGTCLFPGTMNVGTKVYLVTVRHADAYPSIDFKLIEKFDEFLENRPTDNEEDPRNLAQLLVRLHAIAVNTGSFQPYGLQYKRWQRAFYIAGGLGDVRNFVMELDNFIVHLTSTQAHPKFGEFRLHVEIARGIELDLSPTDFEYKSVTVTPNCSQFSVTPLEVFPPSGVRPLVAEMELVSANSIGFTFLGDTYRHRVAFKDRGLIFEKGETSVDTEGQDEWKKKTESFYIMTPKQVDDEDEKKYIMDVFTSGISAAVVLIRCSQTPLKDTAAFSFITELSKLPNVIFLHRPAAENGLSHWSDDMK